jgi:anti-sigma-K factor RskA
MQHELVVVTKGLPVLRRSQVYELWIIGPTRVRPAGLLPAAAAGHTGPVLASGLGRGDKLAMTIEPAGGTSRPTTTPVVALPLPS